LDSPVQKRWRGTGLGLSLSKRLAELLGGRVEVQSESGRGSTFSVTIPNQLTIETQPQAGADQTAKERSDDR
jgi:signal transduction histidine kinase